jgi:uncharacterized membrane protein
MKIDKMWFRRILSVTKDKLVTICQKPELVFVSLALPFGIIMAVTMQLFMAPDEGVHFYRAYQVSQGHLLSETKEGKTGGYIPKEAVEYVENHFSTNVRFGGDPPLPHSEYFKHRVDQGEVFTQFPSSALYSPVSYFPQAIGIAIGKAAYPSVGMMVLMGRLVNLAAFIFLVYWAIRLARHGKWVYTVIGLFPMAIQQASSLSSDVMTTGCVLLFLALVHRCFTQNTLLQRWQLILFITLAIGIALTKQTNIVLLLPILFLPRRLFGSNWKKVGFIAAVGGVALLSALAWYAVLKLGHYNLQISGEPGVNQAGQIDYLLNHPLNFIGILFHTYIFEGFKGLISPDFYLTSAYGVFSWISYKLPLFMIIIGYITLVIALLYRENEKQRDYKNINYLAVIQLLTFLLSLAAIAAALYLTWTPVGKPQAWGIQGRYFIALIPLLIPLFILISRWIKVSFDKPYRFGMIVSIVSFINLAAMIVLTYKWFYT